MISGVPLTRLAFGVVMSFPVKDREQGYKALAKLLPLPIDAEGSSDLFYQINRPRRVAVGSEEYSINRLSKWMVAQLSGLLLQGAGAESFALLPTFVVKVELDINTTPASDRRFDSGKAAQMLECLEELAKEISTRGDIP